MTPPESEALRRSAVHRAGFLRWLAECLSEPRYSRMSDEGRRVIRHESADALRQLGCGVGENPDSQEADEGR